MTDQNYISDTKIANNTFEEAPEKGASSFAVKIPWGLLCAILSGPLFILCFSSWTSPIFKGSYGYDSAFFSMVGRAILEGRVMYRDYFDIKGPVFFFWEALGQFICRDRMGIFVLQIFCIIVTCFFIFRICRLYKLKRNKTIVVFAVFYFIYATCLWGGNSVEEFCLPLLMASLFFGCRFLKYKNSLKEAPENVDIAAFFGVVFGICLFSKVTVCAPAAAVMIVVFADMVIRRDYKNIFRAGCLFLIGTLIVAIPTFIYFILRGSLSEMLLCAFNIAFKRSTDYYEGFSLKWELYLTACYIGLLLFVTRIREKGYDKWILLSLTLVTYLALHLGTPFDYYFITTLPLVVYICVLFGADVQRLYVRIKEDKPYVLRRIVRKILVGCVGIVIICAVYCNKTIHKAKDNYRIATKNTEMQYYDDCVQIFDLIPHADRENIYSIESGMIFYEVNQCLPSNRYPVNMPYFCNLYPPAQDEILGVILNDRPKWIVAKDLENLDNAKIKQTIYDHYEKIMQNSMQQLWRRIE